MIGGMDQFNILTAGAPPPKSKPRCAAWLMALAGMVAISARRRTIFSRRRSRTSKRLPRQRKNAFTEI